jgi:sulfite reductase beta subunit-like hemoprotein
MRCDIPADELPHRIERLLRFYLAHRERGETFHAFASRYSPEQLAVLLSRAAA